MSGINVVVFHFELRRRTHYEVSIIFERFVSTLFDLFM